MKVEQDRRIEALSAFISDYEARYGEITLEEMRAADRRARGRAHRTQPRRGAPRRPGSRK